MYRLLELDAETLLPAAVEKRLELHLTTLQEEAGKQGKDWEETATQNLKERLAIRKMQKDLGLVSEEDAADEEARRESRQKPSVSMSAQSIYEEAVQSALKEEQ